MLLFFDRAYNSQQIEAGYSQPEKGKENQTHVPSQKEPRRALDLSLQLIQPSLLISKPLPLEKKRKEKLLSVQSYLFVGIFLLCLAIHNNHLDD